MSDAFEGVPTRAGYWSQFAVGVMAWAGMGGNERVRSGDYPVERRRPRTVKGLAAAAQRVFERALCDVRIGDHGVVTVTVSNSLLLVGDIPATGL